MVGEVGCEPTSFQFQNTDAWLYASLVWEGEPSKSEKRVSRFSFSPILFQKTRPSRKSQVNATFQELCLIQFGYIALRRWWDSNPQIVCMLLPFGACLYCWSAQVNEAKVYLVIAARTRRPYTTFYGRIRGTCRWLSPFFAWIIGHVFKHMPFPFNAPIKLGSCLTLRIKN